MTARIPATIVTGFLGAGKTTLIRNLIAGAEGRRIALIVNEFGDMGFDGSLLSDCDDDDCKPDTVIELTNGCICCTVADDFLPTIEQLLAREPAPDHIVIETSGLALPQPLVRAFTWPTVRHRVTIDGVITVVDAEAVAAGRFAHDEEAVAAQRAADESLDHEDPIEELFEDQLSCADLIVFSKTDLVDAKQIEEVAEIVARDARKEARVVHANASGLPASVLLGVGAAAEDDAFERKSHHDLEGEEHDHDDFDTFIVDVAELPSIEALGSRVRAAMAEKGVLRIKGRASVAGKAAPAVVQAVGPRVDTYFAPGGNAGRLVVIGERGLDAAAISAHFKA
ncbi:cobalamin biosynthesis protein CobW [Kaistia nematophila]|uniref:Cobalamin biosynthesis protein CobW n=1 Tax=Kaistia nematophila TaxID=2994654 RepID=A0A9X3IJE6_9HYPH|nr:cobalamin biosynthesis protein CobW [Kaistia nematophila]MBN9027564.1 cobalamin biosynthesis protein CobW [Hyphomicrobiales bacterium]MCX5568474.1 cobalamin biosynthesis protein CobW [Kaistia nematophila]